MVSPLNTSKHRLFTDPEFYFLIFYNGLLFYLFYTERIDARAVIWGYYLQSLFVGFQYVGLSTIKKIKATRSLFPISQHAFTLFFIVHFGIFHLVYFVFLTNMSAYGEVEKVFSLLEFLKLSAGAMLINTLFLFLREGLTWTDDYPKPTVITAYLRIIPIHLFIIFTPMAGSGISLSGFSLFILLKLVVDIFIYRVTLGALDFTPKLEKKN